MRDLPAPEPKPGHVTIQVRAFGLNHAKMHMRKGKWDEWMPVTGIECVGIVSACPGAQFEVGSKVAAVMGGMGRSIPGSHNEYTRVPVTNVVQHFHSDTIRHSFRVSAITLFANIITCRSFICADLRDASDVSLPCRILCLAPYWKPGPRCR